MVLRISIARLKPRGLCLPVSGSKKTCLRRWVFLDNSPRGGHFRQSFMLKEKTYPRLLGVLVMVRFPALQTRQSCTLSYWKGNPVLSREVFLAGMYGLMPVLRRLVAVIVTVVAFVRGKSLRFDAILFELFDLAFYLTHFTLVPGKHGRRLDDALFVASGDDLVPEERVVLLLKPVPGVRVCEAPKSPSRTWLTRVCSSASSLTLAVSWSRTMVLTASAPRSLSWLGKSFSSKGSAKSSSSPALAG